MLLFLQSWKQIKTVENRTKKQEIQDALKLTWYS